MVKSDSALLRRISVAADLQSDAQYYKDLQSVLQHSKFNIHN